MPLINASRITKAGAVIITTASSFILTPPSIVDGGSDGVDWKNFATFFVGLLSIGLYNRFGKKKNNARLVLPFAALLFGCVLVYEALYLSYSLPCFDARAVISHGAVKTEAIEKYAYWKRHSTEPVHKLLEASGCDIRKIWGPKDFLAPYLGMLFSYFITLSLTTYLIVLCSDVYVFKNKPEV